MNVDQGHLPATVLDQEAFINGALRGALTGTPSPIGTGVPVSDLPTVEPGTPVVDADLDTGNVVMPVPTLTVSPASTRRSLPVATRAPVASAPVVYDQVRLECRVNADVDFVVNLEVEEIGRQGRTLALLLPHPAAFVPNTSMRFRLRHRGGVESVQFVSSLQFDQRRIYALVFWIEDEPQAV